MNSATMPPPHVAFIAFPFASHPLSIFQIARTVAAAAPSAVVSFLATQRALSSLPPADDTPNLRYVPVADGLPPDASSPPIKDILHQIALFVSSTPGNLKQGISAAVEANGGVPVSCISGDSFMWMSADVAAEMDVPWIPLHAASSAAFLAHLHTDLLRQKFGVDGAVGREEELLDFIPGLEGHRVRDLPKGIIAGGIDSPVSDLCYRMGQRTPKSTAVVFNTFDGLDSAIDASLASALTRYLPIPFHFSSSSPAADPNGCLPWLDRQAPTSVVYVSFGSITTPPLAELAELAEGLEASGVPFIWSLKEASWECLPPGFLARAAAAGQGMVVGWAPQQAVLGHAAVGGFVTHTGWNSVMEAIAAGVPMIGRPIFADHFMASRSMTLEWGNGMGFEGEVMTKEGVVQALDALMRGEKGRQLKARAKELKDAAMAAAAPGGSSHNNFETLLQLMLGSHK
ncbi:myricetin 3-O-rhamnosyltransferase UGT77B2-like [Zingiber officinale]|uniref:Glycosyltransferase n=1 Tax=Zingiber officinale TaxID=94328 RepID=A0A8J5I0V9_ZINOF|nr:myricetin 3-O-rhamnosyltransferase UGT77B2-like [Zingiber officinale]XP_042464159.1 myricetin 3-O-rhamnosyltransferase UGT77B2-like [Zingiber officinale]XP_042464160.1 myricetin 3-O-rhamnosyltransferase UGT77B2-like [Zingiber officinale]XP_042464163.1 myricetin 3-O-rhamnosyltransferase UGT77B2-like [Zingiber officinale]XP_042464164.1 myricetin 3-O-rhamnosyltransferase UGT77B2-like [Zingiber officinale]XP_042464165.1 myricetin 3-O-rhamnosyltransferase UGT77B2-like [Zingiber officinale]XP_04